MKAIEIDGLSYTYPNGAIALENISLCVDEGESIAIIGPNGAGKSTLLLQLNGILRGNGRVTISGKDVKDDPRNMKRKVGILFQDPDDQLFMPSVFDDVAFGPINIGFSDIRERVTRALEMVNLDGYESRCPYHLSYGEKRKVSLASILSMEPEILALDEPTANLDPSSRAELMTIIKKLNEEGKTIVVATHDVNAAAQTADRIYVLNKSLVAEGTTREIFSQFDLLRKENLDVPEVARMFELLQQLGYDCKDLPLSVEEAVIYLAKIMKNK